MLCPSIHGFDGVGIQIYDLEETYRISEEEKNFLKILKKMKLQT